MKKTILCLLTAGLTWTGGCASAPAPVDPLAAMYGGDPADPAMPEAPFTAPAAPEGNLPAPAPSPSHHHGHEGAAPAGDVAYVCPMHPEQTSSEPGTCSICGMDLVPVEGDP